LNIHQKAFACRSTALNLLPTLVARADEVIE